MIEHVEAVRNHWWWRPGWRPGRHFYACHLTFEDQPALHALVDTYRDALREVPVLDLIPNRWLHLTMEGIGFVDEVPDQQLGEIANAIREAYQELEPPTVTFHRPVVVQEAVYLPAQPEQPLRQLRRVTRTAIAKVTGKTLGDIDTPRYYRPHVSAAYVKVDGPSDQIVHALSSSEADPVTVTIRYASLLVFHRDHRMYEWTSATHMPIG